jgi:hypothetical protein
MANSSELGIGLSGISRDAVPDPQITPLSGNEGEKKTSAKVSTKTPVEIFRSSLVRNHPLRVHLTLNSPPRTPNTQWPINW